jgi:hypothetical protein
VTPGNPPERPATPPAADPAATWASFVAELEAQILPIYAGHERTFDAVGIHGRRHIGRAVVFAEYMARVYALKLHVPIDFAAIRLASAFHDLGREDNGTDIWESASAARCLAYLESSAWSARGRDWCNYTSRLILKGDARPEPPDLNWQILHDADVLEIMRPCCEHGGRAGFRSEHLRFLGEHDRLAPALPKAVQIRSRLIEEGWRWIKDTENTAADLVAASPFMPYLLATLAAGGDRYPNLASIVSSASGLDRSPDDVPLHQ